MAHAVSASYIRSDHMSPQALALAFLLHVLTALALWWMSMHPPTFPTESTIDVTIEQAKPSEPPPPQSAPPPALPTPPAQATPLQPQAPATPLGLPPPAPQSTEPPKPQPSQQAPPTPEPPKAEQQQALTPQAPAQPPPPPLDKAVPPPAPPPTPPTSLDYPKPTFPPPAPHPAAPKAPQPPQRAQTPPPQQAIRPSPLSQGHREGVPPARQAAAPSPFHNPAEDVGRTRVTEDYVWQVVRKFSQHIPNMREKNEAGTVVARLVIGRDGRLLELNIARSSGIPTLDKAVIEMIRVAAPYAPLPPEIPGERLTFSLPISTQRIQ